MATKSKAGATICAAASTLSLGAAAYFLFAEPPAPPQRMIADVASIRASVEAQLPRSINGVEIKGQLNQASITPLDNGLLSVGLEVLFEDMISSGTAAASTELLPVLAGTMVVMSPLPAAAVEVKLKPRPEAAGQARETFMSSAKNASNMLISTTSSLPVARLDEIRDAVILEHLRSGDAQLVISSSGMHVSGPAQSNFNMLTLVCALASVIFAIGAAVSVAGGSLSGLLSRRSTMEPETALDDWN